MMDQLMLRVRGDGCIEIVEAPQEIEVADNFLEELRPAPFEIRDSEGKQSGFTLGDGILTIHAANGTVSYGLYSHDVRTSMWRGRRS
jgi:hypothetical protein